MLHNSTETNMKYPDKIRVLVPVSAPDLDKTFKNRRWADDARALFFNLYREKRIMALNRDYNGGLDRDSGWVSVNATEMKEELGIGNRFKKIRDELTGYGCIEWKRSYTPGMYPRLFRVRVPNRINGRMYRHEWITHPSTIENMCEFYNKNYDRQRSDFLDKMDWYRPNLEWAEQMYLDDAAIDYAEQQSPKQAEKLLGSISTFNSRTGRYISVCDFAGRIHSHLGGLDKRLRPFLRVEGDDDELLCIDIKSAQPYLLSNLFSDSRLLQYLDEFQPVMDKISKRESDSSTKLFLRHCQDGSLYEKLMAVTGIKDRDRVKKLLFRHVLYCSASNQHKDKKIKAERLRFQEQFKSLYRSPFETLVALKRSRSKSLPFVKQLTSKRGKGKMYATPNMIAQRLEVAIFLNLITKQLNDAGVITFTIHDAWILKKRDLNAFEEVFASVFEEQLVIRPPMVHIEVLNGATNSIEPEKSEE